MKIYSQKVIMFKKKCAGFLFQAISETDGQSLIWFSLADSLCYKEVREKDRFAFGVCRNSSYLHKYIFRDIIIFYLLNYGVSKGMRSIPCYSCTYPGQAIWPQNEVKNTSNIIILFYNNSHRIKHELNFFIQMRWWMNEMS